MSASESLNLESIFTPTDFPEHTYVYRTFFDEHADEAFDPDKKITDGLNTPGMFVSIVGPSKSGKTIAVKNVVGQENIIEITGSEISEDGNFWSVALGKLGVPVEQKSGEKLTDKKGDELALKSEIGGLGVKGGIEAKFIEGSESSEELVKTVVPSPLDQLAKSAQGKVLLVDDFHYLPKKIQKLIARQIKSTAERKVKICIAEVPHGTHSLIRSNTDLAGRYERVDFSYWNQDDLLKIGQSGFSKLPVSLSNASLCALATEAAGSPQLMQRICLAAARHLLAAPSQKQKNITLSEPEISSIMVKASTRDREVVIEQLIKGPPTRGKDRKSYKLKNGSDADVYETTLLAITANPPMMSISKSEMLNRINSIVASEAPSQGSVTSSLDHMKKIAEKYEPSLRLLDLGSDGMLHIMDPYFFYELRWYPSHRNSRKLLAS